MTYQVGQNGGTLGTEPQSLPFDTQTSSSSFALDFDAGASIAFKVLLSRNVLHSRYRYSIDHQVAHIQAATEILLEAQQIIQEDAVADVLKQDIRDLKQALDEAKTDPVIEDSIRTRLFFLHHIEHVPDTGLATKIWYQNAVDFIKCLKAIEDKYDFRNDIDIACTKVEQEYQKKLQRVRRGTNTAVDEHDCSADERYEKDVQILSFLQHIDEHRANELPEPSKKSVNTKFTYLHCIVEVLSEIIKRHDYEVFKVFSLTDLAYFLDTISIDVEKLLCQYNKENSLKDMFADREVLAHYQGHCHSLVTRAKSAVHDALEDMLQRLEQSTQSHPNLNLERGFVSLARIASTFAFITPVGATETEWSLYVPRMLTLSQYQDFMNKLQHLYTSFQNKAYTEHELPRLWLGVWRGLKATYLGLRYGIIELDRQQFPVESEFFEQATVLNQFEYILAGPDPLHYDVVENVVAEYCIAIASTQAHQTQKYAMQGQQLEDYELNPSVFRSIIQCSRAQMGDSVILRGLQQCATQLNRLLDGPAFVRRMDEQSQPLGDLAYQWQTETVVAPRERTHSPSPISTELAQGPNTVQTSADAPVPSDSDALQARDNSGPDLETYDAVSAFDYVTYPFPETRAVEIAQSRQITREMSQQGIYSRGALAEDVVNCPPRHTLPPGTVSVWARPFPTGPLDVLQDLWSAWREGGPQHRAPRQPRPHPSITARRPRREWADQHPRLRPLLDSRTRVSKVKGKKERSHVSKADESHSPSHIPRLRGGGPGSGSRTGTPTSRASGYNSNDVNQPSEQEQGIRINRLLERMRGFWRGGDLPPTHYVRNYFLVPNHWDVDAAHQSARNFINWGLMGDAFGNAGDEEQGLTDVNSNEPVDHDDPFVDLGITPGSGLDPIMYGVPLFRSEVLPSGFEHGTTPSSPTPLPQRRLMARESTQLDPVLQAHLVRSQTRPVPIDTIDAQVPIPTVEAPEPVAIWVDSPERHTPAAQPRTPPFGTSIGGYAANHQHQPGLSSQNTSHNPSDQENATPTPRQTAFQQRSVPTLDRAPLVMTCVDQTCHPCPHYTGRVHHICAAQARPIHGNIEPIAQRRQQDPSSSSSDIFNAVGITRSVDPWTPEPSNPALNFHARHPVSDDIPSPLVSLQRSSHDSQRSSWSPRRYRDSFGRRNALSDSLHQAESQIIEGDQVQSTTDRIASVDTGCSQTMRTTRSPAPEPSSSETETDSSMDGQSDNSDGDLEYKPQNQQRVTQVFRTTRRTHHNVDLKPAAEENSGNNVAQVVTPLRCQSSNVTAAITQAVQQLDVHAASMQSSAAATQSEAGSKRGTKRRRATVSAGSDTTPRPAKKTATGVAKATANPATAKKRGPGRPKKSTTPASTSVAEGVTGRVTRSAAKNNK